MLSKKSNPLIYMIGDGSKSPKNWFLMHLDPVTKASDLSDRLQDTALWRFFFNRLYLSDSIFFKDSLDWYKGCHENKKKTFF